MNREPPSAAGVTTAPDGYCGTWVPGIPRPDHGEGMRQLVCAVCFAGWVGHPGEACGWCEISYQRRLADERQQLLHPDWLAGCDGPRYDELSEIDKRVWDRTRGQQRDADAMRAWAEQLGRAVTAGVVTEAEARRALRRVKGNSRRAG